MGKIKSIEFFRFFFIMQIALWHFDKCQGIMEHGYSAVEFFFILSGFFLYRTCTKKDSISTIDYFLGRLKRFLPKTLILIPFLIILSPTILKEPIRLINDFTLLSEIGFFNGGLLNPPLWYISVLLIAGTLVYSLLKNYPKLSISVIFPFATILIYTFLVKSNGYNFEVWNTYSCFYMPLWRGFAGISLGVILAHIQHNKCTYITNSHNFMYDIISFVSFIVSIALIFTKQCNDGYFILLYSIIILSCFNTKSIFNKILHSSIFIKLGELSFDIYITHGIVSRIFGYIQFHIINFNPCVSILLYVVSVILSAYLYNLFCSFLFSKIHLK